MSLIHKTNTNDNDYKKKQNKKIHLLYNFNIKTLYIIFKFIHLWMGKIAFLLWEDNSV